MTAPPGSSPQRCSLRRGEYHEDEDETKPPVPCVLKEYMLDEAGAEWQKLVTEVPSRRTLTVMCIDAMPASMILASMRR